MENLIHQCIDEHYDTQTILKMKNIKINEGNKQINFLTEELQKHADIIKIKNKDINGLEKKLKQSQNSLTNTIKDLEILQKKFEKLNKKYKNKKKTKDERIKELMQQINTLEDDIYIKDTILKNIKENIKVEKLTNAETMFVMELNADQSTQEKRQKSNETVVVKKTNEKVNVVPNKASCQECMS